MYKMHILRNWWRFEKLYKHTYFLQCITIKEMYCIVAHGQKYVCIRAILEFRCANVDDRARVAIVTLVTPHL